MPDPIVLPRLARRRGATPRSLTWWGRAFLRSCEELAIDADDLLTARALARSGRLGAIVVLESMASAVLDPGTDTGATPQLKVRRLSGEEWATVVAEAAREARFTAELESGQLPVDLVEQADEAGVELMPGPEDLSTACSCDSWSDPCRHALALLYQLGWHLDTDPHVLLLLRGRTAERLLAEVVAAAAGGVPPGDSELAEARERAAQVLLLARDAPPGHGLADPEVAAYDEEVARLVPGPDAT